MINLKKSMCCLFLAASSTVAIAQTNVVDLVNPIIGTNGMGHTFPGACVPFGLVQLSPDTDTIPHNVDGKYQPRSYEYCAGYQHKDSSIVGFSHTHFSGTGHSDLGDILIMPTTGTLKLNPGTATNPDGGYRSRFSHGTEISRPGYYEVMLADYGVKAQLTTTQRVGIHKYTYPTNSENQRIILDMIHGIYNYDGKVLWTNIRVENDTLVTGYRITNGWARTNYTYFAMSFSKPITHYGCEEKAKVNYRGGYAKFNMKENFPDIGGRKIVAYFDFDPKTSDELEVKVALSGVSTEGALKNLRAEASGADFDQLAAKASDTWNKALSVIDAKGSDDQLAMLYTSLYHTMINPCVYTDVDGQYRGLDHNIHQADGFTNYTVFSVWDTYRALHPLFNIINRQVNTDIAKSMLKHCEQSVHHALPIWSHMANENWCMIGYHAVSVLADMIVKQLPGFDYERAFEAMKRTATNPHYDCLPEYTALGWVPFDKERESVSKTLEYAYDDYCIAQAARALGKEEDYDFFLRRSLSYRNLIDPETKFMRGRDSEGRWRTPFAPVAYQGPGSVHGWGDITEGFTLQYSWYVPHNVADHIERVGRELYGQRLDSLFVTELPDDIPGAHDIQGRIGAYWHGNEPCHHVIYLYNYLGRPWECQRWVRRVSDSFYGNEPGSLSGNDDCGQMSAWYLFNTMGFYPTAPSSNIYNIGSPTVEGVEVRLSNGGTIRMTTENWSPENVYVRKLYVDGREWDKSYLTYAEIRDGVHLHFVMSSRPNRRRAVSADALPPSLPVAVEYR